MRQRISDGKRGGEEREGGRRRRERGEERGSGVKESRKVEGLWLQKGRFRIGLNSFICFYIIFHFFCKVSILENGRILRK